MISRIENIDDLIVWLNSIATLNTKNVKVERLTDNQISSLETAREVLQAIRPKFLNPDDNVLIPFKQCCKCKAIYPETEEWFDYCGQGRTGLSPVCKFCRNAYQKKRKRKGPGSRNPEIDQTSIKTFLEHSV